jgi:nucleoid DNA-binding protein
VEQALGEICDTLVSGESVKLSGFGSFLVRSKVSRERCGFSLARWFETNM